MPFVILYLAKEVKVCYWSFQRTFNYMIKLQMHFCVLEVCALFPLSVGFCAL